MGAALDFPEKAAIGKLVMRVSAIEGHRIWASVYDHGLNPILALERRVMRDVLGPLRPAKVLDVACGTGQSLVHFQQGGSEVFGCDACEEMLSEAMKTVSLRGRVVLADAERIPFGTSTADLVLCSVSLGYFRSIDRVFRELARMAKPGGFIAVSDLHPDALASGWTRSFKLGEQVYELEHYPRAIEEVNAAGRGAGLTPTVYREISFDNPEFSIFQRAGKEDVFSRARRVPAVFIGLWEKPC
jgi:SAM-dependent methyltransferase